MSSHLLKDMEGLMVRHLNHYIRIELAKKLDPPITVDGNDWKMLADKLDYDFQAIMQLEAKQSSSGSNTCKLLEDYSLKGGSSVQNLWNQLEAISRSDCLELLESALPDIRKNYVKEMWPASATTSCAGCPNCQPAYSSHCSEPSDNYTDHCYILGRGQHNSSHHVSVSPQSRQRLARFPSHPVSCHSSCHQSVRYCNCDQVNRRQPSNCQPVNPQSSSRHCSHQNDYVKKIQNVHQASSRTRVRRGYERIISQEDNNWSMEVQSENSQVLLIQEDSTKEQHSRTIHDDLTLPLEQGLLRCLPTDSDTIPSLVQPVDMEVAAEEEVFTSTDSSSSSNSCHGPMFQNPTQVVSRQRAKNRQVMPGDCEKRSYSNSRGLWSGKHSAGHTRGDNYMGDRDKQRLGNRVDHNRNEQFSVNTQNEYPGSDLRQYPQGHFKSSNNTGNIRMQLATDYPHNAEGNGRNGDSGMYPGGRPTSTNLVHRQGIYSNSGVTSNSVPGVPLVCNNNTSLRSTDKLHMAQNKHHMGTNRSTLQSVPKSATGPKTKLADLCRDFGEIRVFVTYATDNEQHEKRVKNLSKCLKKNGFLSSFDADEDQSLMADMNGWYDRHFKEADFVLLCISPQYKKQTDCSSREKRQDPHHTRYIYTLMQTEFKDNCSRNYRFIPLIFPGSTREDVPTWLRNTLIYQWPEQYKDLLWMLTRPHKRVCPNIQNGN